MQHQPTNSGGHVVYHHAKFRWTENLTCRFIQLRKEHGNMFTGRKYSAQAGWEYILQKMRSEFPTIMADVHYRVLKKKWSNLLQQYKELKNPVHGDKNKADDISWPFYTAIDEILGNLTLPQRTRRRRVSKEQQQHHHHHHQPEENNEEYNEEDEDEEEDLNPQEFLSVSVAPDDDDEDDDKDRLNIHFSEEEEHEQQEEGGDEEDDDEIERKPAVPRLHPLKQEVHHAGRSPAFDLNRTSSSKSTARSRRRSDATDSLLSRLPRATELTIRPIPRNGPEVPALEPIRTTNGSLGRSSLEILRGVEELSRAARAEQDEEDRPRKRLKVEDQSGSSGSGSSLERSLAEFMEYTKRRDEENRSILLRMLAAVEDIRKAIQG